MTTIEFQTYIDQGTIELPKEYRKHIKGHARVIIFAEDAGNEHGVADDRAGDTDMIDHLLAHPYRLESLTPLTRDE
ncbi:hypothetical protein V6O07_20090, partial [Arthrospira platensis SPKY2]